MTYVPQPTPLFVAAHHVDHRDRLAKITVYEVLGWDVISGCNSYYPVVASDKFANGLAVFDAEAKPVSPEDDYLRYSRDRNHWNHIAPVIVFADDAPPHEKAAL